MSDKISTAVIRRLPRYYRYLGELLEHNVVRISSKELSEKMDVTASQIRQDLNNFGGFGMQGYGYNVEYLYNEIARILGIDKNNKLIVVGAGNLGTALANYDDFRRRGFIITAMFDIDPKVIGTKINGIRVHDMKELEEYVTTNRVDMAALTVPKSAAPAVAKDLAKWGVHAIWNFAPTDLELPKDVVSENVHLAESIMRLSYKYKALNDKKKK